MPQHTCGGQRITCGSQFSHSPTWVQGFELGWPDLLSCLYLTEPSLWFLVFHSLVYIPRRILLVLIFQNFFQMTLPVNCKTCLPFVSTKGHSVDARPLCGHLMAALHPYNWPAPPLPFLVSAPPPLFNSRAFSQSH